MKSQLQVLGTDIKFVKFKENDYISLIDIAKYKGDKNGSNYSKLDEK